MKYYIGYFNNPCNKNEFKIICACPNKYAADFILSKYEESGLMATYEMLTGAEVMGVQLIL